MYVRSTQLDMHQMGMAEVLSSILSVINILLLNFFSRSKASHANNANIAYCVCSWKTRLYTKSVEVWNKQLNWPVCAELDVLIR